MRSTRTIATCALTVGLLLLTACGGGGSTDEAQPTAEGTPAESTPAAAMTAGSATVTVAGRTSQFELVNCVSGSPTSLQGAGDSADYKLLIDVQEGSGVIQLSDPASYEVEVDGKVASIAVESSGAFTATGSYLTTEGDGSIQLTGTCSMVNWK